MNWTAVPNYEAMSEKTAQRMFDVIAQACSERREVRVGLATGNTMIRLYGLLADKLNKAQTDLSSLSTFNLDEYVDDKGTNVAMNHPLSYRAYMARYFYDLIDPALGFKRENMFFPDARAPEAYDAQIADAGDLDFQLLGVGFDGHIAFNEPIKAEDLPEAAFAELPSRIIRLTELTLRTNARLTAKDDLRIVPHQAVTMGMRSILNAKEIWLLACFPEQSLPLAKMKQGKVSTENPVSFLLTHPSVQVVYTADAIHLEGTKQ